MCSINWSAYRAAVMKHVSGNAWKVFCFLLTCPTASYRTIMEGAGLGSSHTVERALDELITGKHLTKQQDSRWDAPTYTPVAQSAIAPVAEPATPVAESATAPIAQPATDNAPSPVAETATLIGDSIKPKNDDVVVFDPDWKETDQYHTWHDVFPSERFQEDNPKSVEGFAAVLQQVTDMDAWRAACERWRAEKLAGQKRHGQLFEGMLAYYAEEVARRQRPKPEYYFAPEEPRPRMSEEARARLAAMGLPSQRAKLQKVA